MLIYLGNPSPALLRVISKDYKAKAMMHGDIWWPATKAPGYVACPQNLNYKSALIELKVKSLLTKEMAVDNRLSQRHALR
ncbi:unnamed protein product, partial [Symbiodinium sp. CCMP2592]